MEELRKNRLNAAIRLLELIDGTNRSIEISKGMNSPLMVRQYKYLKKKYTLQLQELLTEFKLSAILSDALV